MGKILFRNCRYLITRPDPQDGIIEDGALYIEGPFIIDAGRSNEVEARYANNAGVEVIDARDKIVMPGLVDAHNHVGEVHTLLIPGWLDTPIQDLMDAMDFIYWPAYTWDTEQCVYDLTLFGLLNVIKHGATTHADAMIFPDAIYRASVEARVRTIIHPQMITSVALPDASNEREYLAHTEEAIHNYHNTHDGLIRVGVHPNATFNCTQSLLTKGMELAQKYGVQFAVHIAETPGDKDRSDALWAAEGGLIQHLRSIGLLAPQTLFFHGTLLKESEIDLLAETGAALVHCPATNSWFGYCAYLPYMLRTGMRVGLGTDCITHNLFNAMLSVMQHHNIMPREFKGVESWVPFELATQGGARALGLEDQIGTLEPGKRADVITIDLTRNTSLFPLSKEVLFWILNLNGAGTEVSDALVDGVFIRRDGEFTFLDEQAIIVRAREWCKKFSVDYQAMKRSHKPMFRRVHEEFQRS